MAESGPRAAMTASTIALMRERGVAATSFRDVLAHSGAPRGSVYHHFPEGRTQLIEEATAAAADLLEARFAAHVAERGVLGAVRALVAGWRVDLEKADFLTGCPLVAAGLSVEPTARARAGTAFERLVAVVEAGLVAEGTPPERSRPRASLVVAALEGALVMARARGDVLPLDDVVEEIEVLLGTATRN